LIIGCLVEDTNILKYTRQKNILREMLDSLHLRNAERGEKKNKSIIQSNIERVKVSIFLESSAEILDAKRVLRKREES